MASLEGSSTYWIERNLKQEGRGFTWKADIISVAKDWLTSDRSRAPDPHKLLSLITLFLACIRVLDDHSLSSVSSHAMATSTGDPRKKVTQTVTYVLYERDIELLTTQILKDASRGFQKTMTLLERHDEGSADRLIAASQRGGCLPPPI